MFNKYFGNYILAKKVITPEQLRQVLSEQKSVRVKLGVLAIDSGCMTAFQVDRVHKLQVLQDKRFGEIAITEGFLREDQLVELLSRQKTSQIMLGQILVDEGMLNYQQYENLLADYKKDSGFSDKEIEILKSNNTDAVVKLFLDTVRGEQAELFGEYVELFIRNVVRFIDSEVIIDKPYLADSYQYSNFASQEITGDRTIETGISAGEQVCIKFASIYAEEELKSVDEMVRDSIGEFMNSQNGLFVSNLFHKGINCDLKPQQFTQDGTVTQKKQLFVLPCELNFGKFDIIFNR